MSIIFLTPAEAATHLAKAVRIKRLSLNLSQRTLSEHANVSLAVIKKFEVTGKISLESLLKIALILDSLEPFLNLFKTIDTDKLVTLDEILKQPIKRERGRR